MKGRIDSGLGQIIIDTDVIATYAGSVLENIITKPITFPKKFEI